MPEYRALRFGTDCDLALCICGQIEAEGQGEEINANEGCAGRYTGKLLSCLLSGCVLSQWLLTNIQKEEPSEARAVLEGIPREPDGVDITPRLAERDPSSFHGRPV